MGRPSISVANGAKPSTGVLMGNYTQNGARQGLGLPGRTTSGTENKMNGLHGPKHKRGDIDRECKTVCFVAPSG